MGIYIGAACKFVGYTHDDSFQDLMFGGGAAEPGPGTGQLSVRRTYDSAGPPTTWNGTEYAGSDISVHSVPMSWWSVKGTISTWLNGGYDDEIISMIASFPTGHSALWTLWHEPENTGLSASDWRQAQKRFHRLIVENRGSKDIRMAQGCLIVGTPLFETQAFFESWVSVYEASDTGAFAPPTGFSVGDPAWDLWSWDIYDRYPDNALANRRLEWDALPQGVGNTDGIDGALDKLVTAVRSYQTTPSFTRADLVWAIGELGTERTNQAQADWFADIVQKADTDVSECVAIAYFANDSSGTWAPFPVDAEMQQWIRDNTTDGFYGSAIEPPPETTFITFDTYSDGDPIDPSTGGDPGSDVFDTGFGTFEADAKSIDWGDATAYNNAILIATDASGAAGWDATIQTFNKHGPMGSIYMPNGLPATGAVMFWRARDVSNVERYAVQVSSTGAILLRVNSAQVDATADGIVAGDGTNYWLSGLFDSSGGAGNGTATLHIYDAAGQLLDTLSATGLTYPTDFNDFRIGKFASSTGFHIGFLPITLSTVEEPAIPNFGLAITPDLVQNAIAAHDPAISTANTISVALVDMTAVATDPSVAALATQTITPTLTSILTVAYDPLVSGVGIDILAAETGVFFRHVPSTRLALVYGASRGMHTAFAKSEGWEIVSGRFAFQWDTRSQVLASILSAWSANQNETATTLAAALDAALTSGGYASPDGSAVAYLSPSGVMT